MKDLYSILNIQKSFSFSDLCASMFFCLLCVVTFSETTIAQAIPDRVTITAKGILQVLEVIVEKGDSVIAGDTLAVMKRKDGSKLTIRAGISGTITEWKLEPYRKFKDGEMLGVLHVKPLIIETSTSSSEFNELPLTVMFRELKDSTGLARLI